MQVAQSPEYALGIDVGGTKIYAGVVDLQSGGVLGTGRKRTHPERGVDFFAQRLVTVVEDALEAAKISSGGRVTAIGIGLAGQVDRAAGVLLGAPNLAHGLINYNVRDLLAKRFKLPVALGNDAEIAAYGEQHFGAGRGVDDLVCVFVGTGIGAAIIQGGTLRRGTSGTAGEIGHTIVQFGGRLCGCGGRGHLEAYASRTAVTRVLLAELARGRGSKLSDYMKADDLVIRSSVIARCEAANDTLVMETLLDAGDYLGAGLGSMATFYNPQRIIVGGGLIEATHVLFERASLRAHEAALPAATRNLEIVRTKLGDNSGIVGAAWMAAQSAVPAA